MSPYAGHSSARSPWSRSWTRANWSVASRIRIGTAFDQSREPLPQDHGLAGAGSAHDQEGTGVVVEDPLLRRVGLEGRVRHSAMLPPRADSPARTVGDPPPTGPRCLP